MQLLKIHRLALLGFYKIKFFEDVPFIHTEWYIHNM